MTCSVEGCGKPAFQRGWCCGHYFRWRRHGDPLCGRTADGEPERYYRDVVLPYEGDECLVWPYARGGGGYGNMYRGGRYVRVTRLVCEDEHGPAPSPIHEAAHSCGKGHEGCVARRHLSWKTPVENSADKIKHGTVVRGEAQHRAKLTNADVMEIRALRGSVTQAELAARYGVSRPTVSEVHIGRTWAWLEGDQC